MDMESTKNISHHDSQAENNFEENISKCSKEKKKKKNKVERETLSKSTQLKMDCDEKTNDDSEGSDIEDDLVSAINYNTITSLAALKDMLQSSGENSEGVDSFFHHYFLSHVNRLPSRNQTHSPYPWVRRLSECREEDEYENDEGEVKY